MKKSTSNLELVTPVPDENAVKRAIVEWLIYAGALILRVNSGAAMGKYEDKRGNIKQRFMRFSQWYALGATFKEGQAGISDILALLKDGRFVSVECKTPQRKDEVTEAQRRFMAEVEARGGISIVATGVEDVQQALESAGRRGEGE